ncbi:Hypothetical predicted protein, partial [Podarcis lilfordi]
HNTSQTFRALSEGGRYKSKMLHGQALKGVWNANRIAWRFLMPASYAWVYRDFGRHESAKVLHEELKEGMIT